MKAAYLIILAAMAGLASCQWEKDDKKVKPDIYTDTLTYKYDTIKRRSADCGDKPDSTCTHVEITYPVFNSAPVLNDSISRKLRYMFAYNGETDSTLNRYADNFIKGYTEFKKTDPRSVMYFELESYAHVVRQDSALVTVEVGGYSYQGGAHGASFTTYINWNAKDNKNIKLSDILTDGYNSKLTSVADSIFRKDEKLEPNQPLDNYFFKDNKFALNENFLITPLGLKFLYNQYEIKPYAAGQTELLIPYQNISSLLKPNTVISPYLK